ARCGLGAGPLCIDSSNVDCSDLGNNNNLSNGTTVLQGIGNHHLNGNAQPFDVLGLEELLDTNNNTLTSTSLPALVSDLNAVYGAGTYAYDHTPDPTSGGTQFNGPSGLIYNTHTVQVLSATALGYSGTGPDSIPRAPMRYQIHPIGFSSPAADFYLYASHSQPARGTANTATPNAEATANRANPA